MYYEIKKILSAGKEIEIGLKPNPGKEYLLLLHGFNDTKETFTFLMESLSRNFSVVGMDFRGHGGSEWKQDGIYNFSEYLLDIQNTSMEIPGPFHLLAHSMGAGISARYAGLYPEKIRSLVCLEGFSGIQPAHLEKTKIRNWLDSMGGKSIKKEISRRKMSMEEAEKKLSFVYSNLPPEKISRLTRGLVKSIPGGGVTWKNDPRLKQAAPIPFPPELSRELWQSITCPVLIIFGGNSHLRPRSLDEILSHFRNLTYREIPNSTHNMHHDNPEACLEIINEFYGHHFGFMR